MEQNKQIEEDEVPLLKRLRRSFLPIKESDGVIIRIGKNAAFFVAAILFSLVSLAIVAAMAFAL